MRGTDLTDRQIAAARKFALARNMAAEPRNDEQLIVLPFGDLVRLIAWYGQIRAQAVAKGAPPDEPGETYPQDTRSKEEEE